VTAMSRTLLVIARNLLLLAVAIIPLWFIIAWLSGLLWANSGRTYDTMHAFLVGYAFIIIPVLVAGLVQQVLFTAGVAVRPTLRRRWFAVVTVVIMPLIIALISAPFGVQFSTRFAAATLIALIVFAHSMQMPLPRSVRLNEG
jgi:hypothetical protein